MRKSIIGEDTLLAERETSETWLDLVALAAVEVTSEDPAYPIEAALVSSGTGGWRAAAPGEQIVRLRFDSAQRVRHIRLEVDERSLERTQELTLSWRGETGAFHEIVRQQWNFSPSGSTHECENYRVTLDAVRALELRIKPDIGDGASEAIASLTKLRVG